MINLNLLLLGCNLNLNSKQKSLYGQHLHKRMDVWMQSFLEFKGKTMYIRFLFILKNYNTCTTRKPPTFPRSLMYKSLYY